MKTRLVAALVLGIALIAPPPSLRAMPTSLRVEEPALPPVQPPPTPERPPRKPIDKPLPSNVPPADRPSKPAHAPEPQPGDKDRDGSQDKDKGKDKDAAVADANNDFPTPAELIRRIKEARARQEAMTKVAHFDLVSAVVEKPADFSLFGGDAAGAQTLRSLVKRIRQARVDKDVKGVLVTMGAADMNLAQAQELRDALADVTKSGKRVFIYADGFDTVSYTVASGGSDVCLLQGGEIMIPGIGMETMFAKGLLDKVGVQADYVQIGEYKGADEQYTRTGPSPELRGELNKLADSMYAQLVDGIAQHRKLAPEKVREMIDATILTAEQAKERGFVDHLIHMDELREVMGKKLDAAPDQLALVLDYGLPKQEPLDLSNPFALLALLTKKPAETRPNQPAIALIYAEGTITDGEGGEGMFGGSSVGSDDLRKAFRAAYRDDNVKAVVIRIDSPGGSALASEVMWQAARHLAAKKPVIVSVGSMAASGGYYLASAGDYIFADPSAIVGSIGVVGGKFVLRDLFQKLGIGTEDFTRGANADLFSSNQRFTDRQRQLVRAWMKSTYEQFTQRVMTTRKGKIQDIDAVARGRVFLAPKAKELGMVDELGGIEDAINYAADKAHLDAGQFDVRVLPAPKTLADYFLGTGGADAATPIRAPKVKVDVTAGGAEVLMKLIPADARKALGQQLEMLNLLGQRPVILAAPFSVTVK